MPLSSYEYTAIYIPSIQTIVIADGYSLPEGCLKTYDLFAANTLTLRKLHETMMTASSPYCNLVDGWTRHTLTEGYDGIDYSCTCEIYDPTTNTRALVGCGGYGQSQNISS